MQFRAAQEKAQGKDVVNVVADVSIENDWLSAVHRDLRVSGSDGKDCGKGANKGFHFGVIVAGGRMESRVDG
jgi:hypothetical protein